MASVFRWAPSTFSARDWLSSGARRSHGVLRQRGHGHRASLTDSYTVTQLGIDLETVLSVMAPRGPVVLVGHSMGGMTVLRCAAVPEALSTRIVGVAIIALRRKGFRARRWGDPEEPALERCASPSGTRRKRCIAPRRRQFGDRPDPAGGVLWRREDQPERRGVLREDDARHAHRHASGVPARARATTIRRLSHWRKCPP